MQIPYIPPFHQSSHTFAGAMSLNTSVTLSLGSDLEMSP